ncbi:hypothetical protein BDW71DRAFT_199707 [Aspergillus fruticulosus]
MTFCCLPSQNCLRCRQRRIKVSLLFRDENERIIRRSKAAHERLRAKARAVRGPQASDSNVVLSRPISMTSLDIDTHGLQFFFQQFSHKPADESLLRGSQAMFRDLDTNISFRNAVVSVGLAALSNVKPDRALLTVARQRYGAALKSVRSIVESQPRGDVAVLLKMIMALAIFEMVDAKPETSSSDLLSLGGMGFDARAELWYYLAVIVNHFQVGGPFPAQLDRWPTQRPALLMGKNRPACELIDTLINAEVVLREAVNLEKELQSWMERLPAKWSFITKEAADLRGTFYGQYHVYQDAWASRVLIHYQLGRLLVNEVIVAYGSRLEETAAEWIAQKEHSLVVVSQMATDICIGIASQTLPAQATWPHGGNSPPPMKGIFVNVYSLAAAATATGVSDQLRTWGLRTLQTMGERTGMRQALDAIPQIQLAIRNQKQAELGCQNPMRSSSDGLQDQLSKR